jgi:hypothetical protein
MIAPLTVCILVAAVIMGFTGSSCWDGVAAAGGAGAFELWLAGSGDDGYGPRA